MEKTDCCGCNACVQCCPEACISMTEENEGFLYPEVDKTVCIDCGLCDKVCPVINQGNERNPIAVYTAKNKDEHIREESSSGGVFTLLAEQTILDGGVIFGARFNNKWDVIHDYTETVEGLAPFRGSKYVQSIIGETFIKVAAFLKQGRKVLFSGTPCQIAGLKLFLKKEYDNLITVDFICHGVPSPKVWRLYLQSIIAPKGEAGKNSVLSSLKGAPVITGITFRDKQLGWKKYGFVVRKSALKADKNTVLLSETLDVNLYMRGFLKDLYLRPSCHACPSKSSKSGSDITIADFWGIEKFYPEFDDDKGVSLVFVNTNKGRKVYDMLQIDGFAISFETAISSNQSYSNSVAIPNKRKMFFSELHTNKGVDKYILKYTKGKCFIRFKAFVKIKLNSR